MSPGSRSFASEEQASGTERVYVALFYQPLPARVPALSPSTRGDTASVQHYTEVEETCALLSSLAIRAFSRQFFSCCWRSCSRPVAIRVPQPARVPGQRPLRRLPSRTTPMARPLRLDRRPRSVSSRWYPPPAKCSARSTLTAA